MGAILGKCEFLHEKQIENIMGDRLRMAGLMPTASSPVLDLETLIEQHLKADLDTYCNSLDEGELGVTDFRPGERPKVKINRTLTEEADADLSQGMIGRWRFTLAHEAAHIILHRQGVETAFASTPLFDADETFRFEPFRGDSLRSPKTDSREWQANSGASALLMPHLLFREVAAPLIQAAETFPGEDFRSSRALDLITTEVAQVFRVSKQAVRIRFNSLNLYALRTQTCLEI